MPAMAPVIVENTITEFLTKVTVKLRTVNALRGATCDRVNIRMIHRAVATGPGKAPYKLASYLDSKAVAAFTDSISSGSCKWAASIAWIAPDFGLFRKRVN